MRFIRAHSYDAADRLRAELSIVPDGWREAAGPWGFILLPDDLKPSWIGLTLRSQAELDAAEEANPSGAYHGRGWDDVGGWCASEEHAYWVRETPHIFLAEGQINGGNPAHELAHALERAWHVDAASFFRPETALYDYMATNPHEYFACGLLAFLRQDGDDKRWNRLDLARVNPELHAYLTSRLSLDCT